MSRRRVDLGPCEYPGCDAPAARARGKGGGRWGEKHRVEECWHLCKTHYVMTSEGYNNEWKRTERNRFKRERVVTVDPARLDGRPGGDLSEMHLRELYCAELRASVERAMGVLSVRERRIIGMRYGLDGERARTLVEVGDAVGLTNERVRQIQVTAEQKLSLSSRCRALAEQIGVCAGVNGAGSSAGGEERAFEA